jgi:probable 2-oxoglutarate dehydrogenase E1 component DHKTD1
MTSKSERYFLINLLETSYGRQITDERKLRFWELLNKSDKFDVWTQAKFPNVKRSVGFTSVIQCINPDCRSIHRYGLEGGESTMVLLDVLVECSKSKGVKDIILAMPHRGRLNILTQFMDLDMRILLRKVRHDVFIISFLSQPVLFADTPFSL